MRARTAVFANDGRPAPARREGHPSLRWSFMLGLAGVGLVAVAFIGVGFSGDINAVRQIAISPSS